MYSGPTEAEFWEAIGMRDEIINVSVKRLRKALVTIYEMDCNTFRIEDAQEVARKVLGLTKPRSE